jgi:hypothetical protein
MHENRKWQALLVLMTCVGLAGCAAVAPVKPETLVAERAQAYWGAVIAGRWDVAYEFTTPGYRSEVDAFGFRKRHDTFIKYKQAEVLSVECENEELCKAKVRIDLAIADTPVVQRFDHVVEERWLRERGSWYRYVER